LRSFGGPKAQQYFRAENSQVRDCWVTALRELAARASGNTEVAHPIVVRLEGGPRMEEVAVESADGLES
jgi:hypothetical protein